MAMKDCTTKDCTATNATNCATMNTGATNCTTRDTGATNCTTKDCMPKGSHTKDCKTYACQNCGTVHKADGGNPPRACMKCEGNKFIKR